MWQQNVFYSHGFVKTVRGFVCMYLLEELFYSNGGAEREQKLTTFTSCYLNTHIYTECSSAIF